MIKQYINVSSWRGCWSNLTRLMIKYLVGIRISPRLEKEPWKLQILRTRGATKRNWGKEWGSKPKRQKPSVKSRAKMQESMQGAKSQMIFWSQFKLIRTSPTEHGFPGEPSPLLAGIHIPLKEPAGIRWLGGWERLQRLKLSGLPRVSK